MKRTMKTTSKHLPAHLTTQFLKAKQWSHRKCFNKSCPQKPIKIDKSRKRKTRNRILICFNVTCQAKLQWKILSKTRSQLWVFIKGGNLKRGVCLKRTKVLWNSQIPKFKNSQKFHETRFRNRRITSISEKWQQCLILILLRMKSNLFRNQSFSIKKLKIL